MGELPQTVSTGNPPHEFPRGSTWRKWDFHVHTPSSYDHQFGTDWNAYVTSLIEAIKARGVGAIALSDYFSIDGYRVLHDRGYYDSETGVLRCKGLVASVLLIPGIELRLSTFTSRDSAVNIHVMFDPSVLSGQAIQDRFLSRLRVAGAPDGRTVFARREDIIAIGRRAVVGSEVNLFSTAKEDPEDEENYLRSGLATVCVSLESLQEVLEELRAGDPKKSPPYLVVLAARGHGGLGDMDWLGRAGLLKEANLRFVDMLFERSRDGVAFHLGRHSGTPEVEYVRRFGALKPCIWGSDAKEMSKLLRPNGDSGKDYTWVKANLSFEGLRQITYEPEIRVCVQPEEPELKAAYLVIDSVRFVPNDRRFSDAWLPISKNLTAIIGGKSAGKSLLLYNIADTVDHEYVEQKFPKGAPYGAVSALPDFEVRWCDGVSQRRSAPGAVPGRSITYIPQSFINEIAEDGRANELHNLILRVLKEEEGFLTKFEEHRAAVHAAASEAKKSLESCMALREQASQDREQLKTLGEPAAIQAEMGRSQKLLEDLREGTGVSLQDEARHEELRTLLATVVEGKQRLDRRLTAFEGLAREFDGSLLTQLESLLTAAFRRSAERLLLEDAEGHEAIRIATGSVIQQAREFLSSARRSLPETSALERDRDTLRAQEATVEGELTGFREKFQNRKQLEEVELRIRDQRELLGKIGERERDLATREETLRHEIDRLFGYVKALRSLRENFIAAALPEAARRISERISLSAQVSFNADRFTEQLWEPLDKRSSFFKQFSCFSETGIYRYESEGHHQSLRAIFDYFFAGKGLRLKSNYRASDVLERLVGDYFEVSLSVVADGDSLASMSPGKRGMVLLQLLLERSNAKHPILLDQPEDNLDNRTIFAELRSALRRKKVDRQIIIVTHDPNLVVAADAEEVVVANQNGQREAAENERYRFEYVSGALENSFRDLTGKGVLFRGGIREHVCELLEGGEEAFRSRQRKYSLR